MRTKGDYMNNFFLLASFMIGTILGSAPNYWIPAAGWGTNFTATNDRVFCHKCLWTFNKTDHHICYPCTNPSECRDKGLRYHSTPVCPFAKK